MIEIKKLQDCNAANKFGTCAGCGKFSDSDAKMVRITFDYNESYSRTSVCLCNDCREELEKELTKGQKSDKESTYAAVDIVCLNCAEDTLNNEDVCQNCPVRKTADSINRKA